MYFETNPCRRTDLIEYAAKVRSIYQCEDSLYFPIISILDKLSLCNKLDYLILEDDDPMLDENTLAYYSFNNDTIYVKTSVWLEAENNIGRSRFTLTHEFSHYLLFKVFGFGIQEIEKEPVAYKDPEWQANYLAGALLMPFDKTLHFTKEELIEKCVVSEESAIVHIDAAKKIK